MTRKIPIKSNIAFALAIVALLFSLALVSPKKDTASQRTELQNNILVDGNISSSTPSRLQIPRIHIDARVEEVGTTTLDAMGTPSGPETIGWYKPGKIPGEIGSSVMDGHSGWKNNIPAVFDNLDNIRRGDQILVTDKSGKIQSFIVQEIRIYPKNADATEVFSSNDGKAHLNLITCSGLWDNITKSSSDRLIVFAEIE